MLPHTHFLAGFVAGLVGAKLGYFTFYDAVIIALLSVVIDIDHLVYFFEDRHKLNPLKCWNYCVDRKGGRTLIHYPSGVIAISLVFLAVFFLNHKIGIMLFAAYYSHLLLDFEFMNFKVLDKFITFKFGSIKYPLFFLECGVQIVLLIAMVLLVLMV